MLPNLGAQHDGHCFWDAPRAVGINPDLLDGWPDRGQDLGEEGVPGQLASREGREADRAGPAVRGGAKGEVILEVEALDVLAYETLDGGLDARHRERAQQGD